MHSFLSLSLSLSHTPSFTLSISTSHPGSLTKPVAFERSISHTRSQTQSSVWAVAEWSILAQDCAGSNPIVDNSFRTFYFLVVVKKRLK